MSVQHRILASSSKSWETLCAEASAFASEIGREKLINISVAASGGTDVFGLGAAESSSCGIGSEGHRLD